MRPQKQAPPLGRPTAGRYDGAAAIERNIVVVSPAQSLIPLILSQGGRKIARSCCDPDPITTSSSFALPPPRPFTLTPHRVVLTRQGCWPSALVLPLWPLRPPPGKWNGAG